MLLDMADESLQDDGQRRCGAEVQGEVLRACTVLVSCLCSSACCLWWESDAKECRLWPLPHLAAQCASMSIKSCPAHLHLGHIVTQNACMLHSMMEPNDQAAGRMLLTCS